MTSEHKLTVIAESGCGDRIGRCVCGWTIRCKTKAEVEERYERHCDRSVLARLAREENE